MSKSPLLETITPQTAFEFILGREPQSDIVLLHRVVFGPCQVYFIEEVKDGSYYVAEMDQHYNFLPRAIHALSRLAEKGS